MRQTIERERFLDHIFFWRPQKEIVVKEHYIPPSVLLKYPTDLYADNIAQSRNPNILAIDALMLGALADRSKLFQQIGEETFTLRVSDLDPYPAFKGFSDTFSINSNLIEFLRRETRLISGDVSENQVKDWFLRAVNLHTRFEQADAAVLRVGGKTWPVDHQGIADAWKAAQLPYVELYLEPGQAPLVHFPFYTPE